MSTAISSSKLDNYSYEPKTSTLGSEKGSEKNGNASTKIKMFQSAVNKSSDSSQQRVSSSPQRVKRVIEQLNKEKAKVSETQKIAETQKIIKTPEVGNHPTQNSEPMGIWDVLRAILYCIGVLIWAVIEALARGM